MSSKNFKTFNVLLRDSIKSIKIDDRFEYSWKNFAINTSFHGFSELQRAKFGFWKIFWFLICSSACILTFYQICTAIIEFVKQPTQTEILHVEDRDIFYPPLSLCYWQWFNWVDLDKAAKLYPKEILLASFSFINPTFSEESYDINAAVEKLQELMNLKNLSGLMEFYKSVVRETPVEEIPFYDVKSNFGEWRFLRKDSYLLFCYQISSEKISEYFKYHTIDEVILFNTIDNKYNHIKNYVTPLEYNKYAFDMISKQTMYKTDNNDSIDFLSYTPPISLMLFLDSSKSLDLSQNCDIYVITIKATVFHWLNRPNKPCTKRWNTVPANHSCQDKCQSEYELKDCSCLNLENAILINSDTVNKVCRQNIKFLSNVTEGYGKKQWCSKNSTHIQIRESCLSGCLPSCKIWKYEKSFTTKTTDVALRNFGVKSYTQVYIEYPSGQGIVIMQENNVQTWETLVGNVGGILGIWTGASVVSFFQLFYLCCVIDGKCCSFSRKLSKIDIVNSIHCENDDNHSRVTDITHHITVL